MSDFASRLRRIRESKEVSLYRLAQLTGLSKQGVINLEVEGADPKLSTVRKLADALGVSPSELLAGDGTAPARSTRVDQAILAHIAGTTRAWLTAEQIAEKVRPEFDASVPVRDVVSALCNMTPTPEHPYRVERSGEGESTKYRVVKMKGRVVTPELIAKWSAELIPTMEKLIREAQKSRVEISMTQLCFWASEIQKVLEQTPLGEAADGASTVVDHQSATDLYDRLEPLLDELDEIGAMHVAMISPGMVRQVAFKLRKLFDRPKRKK